jgi:NDP-sugar pyrophosphorylase family protein
MSAGSATRCLESIDVLVLAGGLGTRLRPAIGESPKLLATVAGRPYLSLLLDWLTRFGARRIVLSLGYKADAVLDFLSRQPRQDLDIVPVVEAEPLGTAGAIRLARSELRTDPVLALNGDSFADADLCALLARHREAGASGTLLCAEVDDARRYGRVAVDGAGCITRFIEKDPDVRGPAPVSTGIYVLSGRLLDVIATGTGASLESDVFAVLPAGSLAAMVGRYRFVDIGTPASLARAAAVLGSPAA